MNNENRLNKAIEKTKDNRRPRVNLPKEARFLGELVNKDAIQTELNELDHQERVVVLTQNERIDLIDRLRNKSKENMLEGLSLYSEYRELISDEFDDHEDRHEAYWISSDYLQELSDRKSITEYYESLRDEF